LRVRFGAPMMPVRARVQDRFAPKGEQDQAT
jgi:hypothetical protein